MGIDTSMYQTITPPPAIQQPDMLSALGKGYATAQMANQINTERGMRDAYSQNVGPDGKLNQDQFLSDLGRVSPMASIKMRESLAQSTKMAAEAQKSQMEAAHSVLSITQPKMEYLATVPDAEKPTAFNSLMRELESQGAPMHNVPKDSQGNYLYDPGWFRQSLLSGRQAKESLDNQLLQANIGKTQSETAMAPAKLNAELYGSRSPNAELSSQYGKDVAPIRNSQLFMNQMMDAHKNKTPQGDAALVLANFKIRNPQAVDVNSIDEMKESQAYGDKWKNKLNEALNGGFDETTRNNLLRDGISAYRANMETFRGIQQRYQRRQSVQNVNDPSLTYEPGIEDTNKAITAMQDKLGPYVPPSERGGVMAGVSKFASNLIGGGSKDSGAAKEDQSGNAYAGKPKAALTPADAEAMHWLQKNPTDPHADAIRAKLKSKGFM